MKLNGKTQTMVMTALMAALLAVLSPFTIPLGPIPLTLGIFIVCFTGAMLPPPHALAALAVYILLGCIGLPVFAGFNAGPQVLVGPTGGYIVGYFLIALCISLAVKYSGRYVLRLAAALGGIALCYLLGTLWYVFVTGASFLSGLAACVAPFALWDILKSAAALGLATALEKRMLRAGQNQ